MSKVAKPGASLMTYPDEVRAHTKVQQLYFDDDFMLRRLDYVTDVLGGVAA
jgi:hypothetical protein